MASQLNILDGRLAPAPLRAVLRPLRSLLNGWLINAVSNGSPDSASKALSLGANPNARAEAGFTPLTLNHVLDDQACAAMAKLLISFGADPDLPNLDGIRPLHYAAQFAKHELCKALLAGGADPEAQNAQGEDPVEMLRAFQAKSPQHHQVDHASAIASLFESESLRRSSQSLAAGSSLGGGAPRRSRL